MAKCIGIISLFIMFIHACSIEESKEIFASTIENRDIESHQALVKVNSNCLGFFTDSKTIITLKGCLTDDYAIWSYLNYEWNHVDLGDQIVEKSDESEVAVIKLANPDSPFQLTVGLSSYRDRVRLLIPGSIINCDIDEPISYCANENTPIGGPIINGNGQVIGIQSTPGVDCNEEQCKSSFVPSNEW